MVIQENMPSKSIVETWPETGPIFEKYNVPFVGESLEKLVSARTLPDLLIELNTVIGSTAETCVGGG